MRNLLQLSVLVLSILVLQACGMIQDRSSEYTRATVATPIVIPEGLSDDKVQTQYPIPVISNKRPLAAEYELPKPPNATAVLDEAPYLVEQLEDQVWLRVYSSPGRVWPLLDAFWREFGIEPAQENIASGFVVTKALEDPVKLKQAVAEKLSGTPENSSISLENRYFQAKLAQGIRRNTSEIKLRILDAKQINEINNSWQPDSQNLAGEKAVLEVMGAFITSDALQNRYSLLANAIGGESRVQLLQNDQGENYLLINLSFQRAWNELEKALKAAEIVVADKDFSAKKYFISYLNESEISEWYFSDSRINEMKSERNFSLTLEEMPDGGIKVEVQQLNEKLESALKNELLDLVFEHIS